MPYLGLVHFLKNVLVKIVSYGIFAKTAPLFSVETQCETVWTLLSTAHAVEKTLFVNKPNMNIENITP